MSDFFPLPQIVSDGIKNGEGLGLLICEYYQKHPSSEIEDLTSRQPTFIQAIQRSLHQINN